MISFFLRITLLIFFFAEISIGSMASAQSDDRTISPDEWERFRAVAPHHMQDWILVGEGPIFTLIHSEPPPAYDRAGYEAVYQATFRGFESFNTRSGRLGFNGSYTDIVATMDYGFAGEDALRELEADLRALSQEIYGTSYGARFLRLGDLERNPVAPMAGAPIAVSAAEVYAWLYDSDLIFASPETGVSGSLDQIRRQRTGRYLSSDGSLVLLIIDRNASLEFSDVGHIRHFVLDTDLIVGGVIDKTLELTYVVGRTRQMDWFDFPPLRVEDVLNLIGQKNGDLAQSYDRTTPGAGRVTHDGNEQDWAPSFLSRELIDTEFGSLLNEADAILKSQSLGDTISYVGFDIDGIQNPPDDTEEWPRGVWDRLNAEINLTSLIFNFNTIGSGHWYAANGEVDVYAPNQTGSYSVTYSPFTAGETSLSPELKPEADLIAEAEREYDAWFNDSGNVTLARAVQYTSLFQIFKEPVDVAVTGYPERQQRFDRVGEALQTAISIGFESCLPEGEVGNQRFSVLLQRYKQLKAAQAFGFRREIQLPQVFPDDRVMLLNWVADAATQLRYDGNIFGSEVQELEQRRMALERQLEAADLTSDQAIAEYDAHVRMIEASYQLKPYPIMITDENGMQVPGLELRRKNGSMREYTSGEQSAADRWLLLSNVRNAEIGYFNQLQSDYGEFIDDYNQLSLALLDRNRLADFVARQCDADVNSNDATFRAYVSLSAEEGLNQEGMSILQTPTIVLSRNELDENFLGGHNVKRQGLEIRFGSEAEIGPDGFSLVDNLLIIPSNLASELPALSEAMARVRNADPVTQKAAFDAVITNSLAPLRAPNEALGINAQTSGDTSLHGVPINRAEIGTQPTENGLRLGWGEQGMFMDQRRDGEVRRASLFGTSYGLPQLLESRLADHRVAQIEFDATLDATTREAVIDNFIRERPATAAGGGGKGGDGNGRWRVASGEPNQGPRLVIFVDETTGRSRFVLETNRGRMEVVLEQSARREEVLEVLSQRIEEGAQLELTSVKIAVDGAGGRATFTDFVVQQESALSGTVAGFVVRGLDAANRTITEAFSAALRRAFSRVTEDAAQNGTNGDLLIEFQSTAMETGYFRRVTGKIEIDDHGMRWILFVEPNVQESGPIATRGSDL